MSGISHSWRVRNTLAWLVNVRGCGCAFYTGHNALGKCKNCGGRVDAAPLGRWAAVVVWAVAAVFAAICVYAAAAGAPAVLGLLGWTVPVLAGLGVWAWRW